MSNSTGLWHFSWSVCLCVHPGLLLLCIVASEVWDAETKPLDFVCKTAARRAMNIVAEIESALVRIYLPCTELHVASWENKSHQEKRGDIVASLGLLTEGVKVLKGLSQPRCGSLLLQRLENNINNYLLILTHIQLSVRSCHCSKIMTTFLTRYKQLIIGKLERFVVNLENRCTAQ
uniref:Thrombopoietin n=1 Tax=Mastacembelus armatus TaxID=205130 RepID=A0A7N8WI09_9TELE